MDAERQGGGDVAMQSGLGTLPAIVVDPREVVDLAADLIRMPSVSGGEADLVQLLAQVLRREGIDAQIEEVLPGRPNLIAALGEGEGPTLWLNGHLDTVPIGHRLTWSREPFGGDQVDGRLYGRGASDCKGGVAAMIHAAIALRRAGIPLAGTLRLTAVMGDEEGWIGIRRLLAGGMRADAFVSTQWSTAGQIALGYRGLCWIELTTIGRSAHGSRPASGINAIEQMVDLVLPALRSLKLPSARETAVTIPGSSVNLAMLTGGFAPNIVPDHCQARLDYRLVTGQSSEAVVDAVERVLASLRAAHPQLTVESQVILRAEPLYTEPDCALVQGLGGAIERVTGRPAQYFGKTGTADVNLVHERLHVPAVSYGPGNDSGHGPDEWVSVEDLVEVTKVYAAFAADFLRERA
jgi:acetylornithine deacetylase/succinyl-diaminopimelate desuccinylase family protein